LVPTLRGARRNPGRASTLGPGFCASVVLVLFALAVTSCGGGSGGSAGSADGSHYASALPGKTTGSYPSFLPKKTLDPAVDATLVGTEARPALQVEGLPIEVRTKAFDVHVTVAGPIVPGQGLPYQQPATTSTWTVTMKDATADVPVSLADFHAVDHLGHVSVPTLVPGAHRPPRVLHRGQTLTFQMRAYELVGQGTMQWAPDHAHVVGNWDYTVEND
jgi:hypothetical protein